MFGLRNSKIWIENDWTNEGLTIELLGKSLPSEDMVLAFHLREMRAHTEFTVA